MLCSVVRSQECCELELLKGAMDTIKCQDGVRIYRSDVTFLGCFKVPGKLQGALGGVR